jgi:hypothetical protein
VAVVVAIVWYVTHLQSEIARLRSSGMARDTAAAPAAAPPVPNGGAEEAPAAALGGDRAITPEERTVMVEALGGGGVSGENPVWFATVPNDPEAAALQRTLAGVFEEAGWQVRGTIPVRFAMKPGVFVFAADEEPPAYVEQASGALEAGGIPIAASGIGYRSFYEQKKQEDPNWVGLDLGPDVTYVIVIGRKPPADPVS